MLELSAGLFYLLSPEAMPKDEGRELKARNLNICANDHNDDNDSLLLLQVRLGVHA
jgi:hypothetical protein